MGKRLYNTSGNSCRDLPVLLEAAALLTITTATMTWGWSLSYRIFASAAASKEDAGYLNTEVFLYAQQMQDIQIFQNITSSSSSWGGHQLHHEEPKGLSEGQMLCSQWGWSRDHVVTHNDTSSHFPAGLILHIKMISLATSDRSCSAAPWNSQHSKPGWKGSSVPQVLGSHCIARTAQCYRPENKYMCSCNWEYLHLPTTICSSGQKLWSSFIKLNTIGQK